ncbi:MAG TPA: PQQ-dependent sugar dehydrogenase, partial [Terriglobales bacterium]|nr:PQQ-dependent sugar dehydrogenase [Terriglobales bacterium]
MPRLKRASPMIASCVLLLAVVAFVGCGSTSKTSSNPAPPNSPTSPTPPPTPPPPTPPPPSPPPPATDKDLQTQDVATGLAVPWSLAFAPDGRLFFTEQPGRLRVITSQGLLATPLLDVTSTTAGGEAGTTGMDLDHNFATNGFLYMHYCLKAPSLHCQVVRVIVTPQNTATIDKV